jgi:hypothetical protein
VNKHQRFFNIIVAMQFFAGKSMKLTDAAESLTEAEIRTIEAALLKVSARCREYSTNPDFADLLKLANEIDHWMAKSEAEDK